MAARLAPTSSSASLVEHVLARDGTPLLVRRWRVSREPWAVLLLVHGIGEHSGRYEHVGAQLAQSGIECEALDLRGFGGSGGHRAWVDRWSQLHDDLEERVAALRQAYPSTPLVLYGHSMGGLVVVGYVLDARARPDMVVVSAPSLDVAIGPWKRLVARALGRVMPKRTLANGIDPTVLMADAEGQAGYVTDPLNVHRTTVRFALAGLDEQRRVRRALDRLAIPTLVLHGGEDVLVPVASSEVFEGRAGVTRRVFEGARHEVHNEDVGPAAVDLVVTWIREQVSRLQ